MHEPLLPNQTLEQNQATHLNGQKILKRGFKLEPDHRNSIKSMLFGSTESLQNHGVVTEDVKVVPSQSLTPPPNNDPCHTVVNTVKCPNLFSS
jgi:hypothetical protein